MSNTTSENTSESKSKSKSKSKSQSPSASDSVESSYNLASPKSTKSTSSNHEKNMRRYYKNKENNEKLQIRIVKYTLERDILDAKIQDLQKYLTMETEEEPEAEKSCGGTH